MKKEFSEENIRLLFTDNGIQENYIKDAVKVIIILMDGSKPKRKNLEKLVKSPKLLDKLTEDKILILRKNRYSLNKNSLYDLVEKTFGNEQKYF